MNEYHLDLPATDLDDRTAARLATLAALRVKSRTPIAKLAREMDSADFLFTTKEAIRREFEMLVADEMTAKQVAKSAKYAIKSVCEETETHYSDGMPKNHGRKVNFEDGTVDGVPNPFRRRSARRRPGSIEPEHEARHANDIMFPNGTSMNAQIDKAAGGNNDMITKAAEQQVPVTVADWITMNGGEYVWKQETVSVYKIADIQVAVEGDIFIAGSEDLGVIATGRGVTDIIAALDPNVE